MNVGGIILKTCIIDGCNEKYHAKELCKKHYYIEYNNLPERKAFTKLYQLKRYNLTFEEYEQMVKDQDNKCAVCGKPETFIDNRSHKIINLSVDHNHKTGKNRGLLCGKCNIDLGHYEKFMDDKKLCKVYDEYILKFNIGE